MMAHKEPKLKYQEFKAIVCNKHFSLNNKRMYLVSVRKQASDLYRYKLFNYEMEVMYEKPSLPG